MMNSLIAAHASINLQASGGPTALLLAAAAGQTQSVALLLEANASMNITSNDGSTALILAAARGFTEIVRVLLASGSNASARTGKGWTALSTAHFHGHRTIVSLLESDAKQLRSMHKLPLTLELYEALLPYRTLVWGSLALLLFCAYACHLRRGHLRHPNTSRGRAYSARRLMEERASSIHALKLSLVSQVTGLVARVSTSCSSTTYLVVATYLVVDLSATLWLWRAHSSRALFAHTVASVPTSMLFYLLLETDTPSISMYTWVFRTVWRLAFAVGTIQQRLVDSTRVDVQSAQAGLQGVSEEATWQSQFTGWLTLPSDVHAAIYTSAVGFYGLMIYMVVNRRVTLWHALRTTYGTSGVVAIVGNSILHIRQAEGGSLPIYYPCGFSFEHAILLPATYIVIAALATPRNRESLRMLLLRGVRVGEPVGESGTPTLELPLSTHIIASPEAAAMGCGQTLAHLCVVCLDSKSTHLVVPCGHKCLCAGCAVLDGWDTCPVCCTAATSLCKVFDVEVPT